MQTSITPALLASKRALSVLMTSMALIAILASTSVMADSVNINSADSKALAATIDGVGEKLGSAIVEHRRRHGPFKNIDELVDVKGVGPKLVERNRPRLRIDTPAEVSKPSQSD